MKNQLLPSLPKLPSKPATLREIEALTKPFILTTIIVSHVREGILEYGRSFSIHLMIDDFLQDFVSNERGETITSKIYRQKLTQMCMFLYGRHVYSTRQISRTDIKDFFVFKRESSDRFKKTTENGYRIAIRSWLRWCEYEGVPCIRPNSVRLLRIRPKDIRDKVLSPAGLRALLQTIASRGYSRLFTLRDMIIMLIFFESALRLSEVRNIRIQNIDLDTQQVRVIAKGGKMHIAFFSEGTAELIREYLSLRTDDSEMLFVQHGKNQQYLEYSKPLTRQAIYKTIKRYTDDKNIHPHAFRHSSLTNHLRNGLSIFEVKQIAGHENINTTCRYLHLANEELKAKARQSFAKMTL